MSCEIRASVKTGKVGSSRYRKRQYLHLSCSSVRSTDRVNRSWNFNYNVDNPSEGPGQGEGEIEWHASSAAGAAFAKAGRWTMLLVADRSWHGVSDRLAREGDRTDSGSPEAETRFKLFLRWHSPGVAEPAGGAEHSSTVHGAAYKFPHSEIKARRQERRSQEGRERPASARGLKKTDKREE